MKNICTRVTNVVPIYNSLGEKLDEIILREKIMPIPTKRGGFAESGNYYKGAGIVYRNHLECDNKYAEKNNSQAQIIGRTGLVYENLVACYTELVGRFGIFTFKHQPIFSDYEGGCGIKEKKLEAHQKAFELNAIDEILNVIPTGIANHSIYCYRLKNLKGNIKDTVNLIRYVLENDWNTAWDKNLWEDIECFGYVRDVADWFKSVEFKHKLGTMYALLNSLYRIDKRMYASLLLEMLNYYDFDKKRVLFLSAEIVKKYCTRFKDTEYDYNLDDENWFERLYKNLVSGKSCCHLEDNMKWNWVREYYLNKTKNNGGD